MSSECGNQIIPRAKNKWSSLFRCISCVGIRAESSEPTPPRPQHCPHTAQRKGAIQGGGVAEGNFPAALCRFIDSA